MTDNGIRFIEDFYPVISTAASHTHISALPLIITPPSTLLYQTFIKDSVAQQPWVVSNPDENVLAP
jgi:hypothetical protein